MNEESEMSFEELQTFKEEGTNIDTNSFEVNNGICKVCNEKLVNVVENRSLFDGTITIHIIKLKCIKCGRKYLDLDQAEKYDLLLKLEKASKEPIEILAKKFD